MHRISKKFTAVLFDLDGTLIDTAPDLAAALNHVLHLHNKPSLLLETIRPVASDGAAGLLKLGFNIFPGTKKFEELKICLLAYYEKNIAQKSCLFPGINNILDQCEEKNIPWGIVTNKPAYLTKKLLSALQLEKRTDCIVCGDTLAQKKPHPAPLLFAAEKLKHSIQHCCYIGDAPRDMASAKSAGMFAIAALYGYVNEADILSAQADSVIFSPDDLRKFIF